MKSLRWMGVALSLGLAGPAFAAVDLQAEAGGQAYTGPLSDSLRGGPAWGVDANMRPPAAPLGIELRYQGASNQLFGSGSIFNGPRAARVVQNGGEALAHVSLTPERTQLEPFLGAGIGIARYTLSDPVPGYQDDTLGEVPLSAGINYKPRIAEAARLTVGVRADYKVLFSDQFAPTDRTTDYGIFTKQGGDTYRGEVTLGGSF